MKTAIALAEDVFNLSVLSVVCFLILLREEINLLKSGACVNLVNSDGFTALRLAEQLLYHEIVEAIQKHTKG